MILCMFGKALERLRIAKLETSWVHSLLAQLLVVEAYSIHLTHSNATFNLRAFLPHSAARMVLR